METKTLGQLVTLPDGVGSRSYQGSRCMIWVRVYKAFRVSGRFHQFKPDVLISNVGQKYEQFGSMWISRTELRQGNIPCGVKTKGVDRVVIKMLP